MRSEGTVLSWNPWKNAAVFPLLRRGTGTVRSRGSSGRQGRGFSVTQLAESRARNLLLLENSFNPFKAAAHPLSLEMYLALGLSQWP